MCRHAYDGIYFLNKFNVKFLLLTLLLNLSIHKYLVFADLVYSAQFKNLIEEKDLPQSVKAKIQKLKEWAEQQPKQSPKKGMY